MFESYTDNISQQEPENSSFSLSDCAVAVYSSIDDEYDSLRHGVAIRNISFMQLIELSGSEVLDFLHRIATNTLRELKENKRTRTLFLNEKGRIIDRATILHFVDKTIVVANRDQNSKLKKWVERYIITEDIVVTTPEKKYFVLEILGPQACSFLMQFAGSLISSIDDNILNFNSSDVQFQIMKFKEKSGCEKFWLIGDYSEINKIIMFLLSSNNIFSPVLVGEDAIEIFRIEQGIPTLPNEINDNINPHEVNLIDEVSFTKGCYIGQEVIARLDTYDKVQKRMRGLILESPTELTAPIQLLGSGSDNAGMITSIVNSKLLGKQIGLGIISKNYLHGENNLRFMNSAHEIKVKIIDLPFKK
ncbi:MAG: hypothetical protein V1720_02570 [bacterium]